MDQDSTRELLRHIVATIAYRAAKAVRGAPEAFASFRAGPTTRTPNEIVAHMGDLFDWSLGLVRGEAKWRSSTPLPWSREVERLFASIHAFDDHLASDSPLAMAEALVFQGPVSDALTHVGQLAMLRRLSGAPMRGESYVKAAVRSGRVGLDQDPPQPRYEFD